jgi:hypothetical protein
MTPSGGTVTIDPGFLPCKIHVTKADGTTPVAFNDAGNASRLTLPVETIGEDKVIYLAADGTYTVTIWVDNVQVYCTASSVTGGGDVAISVPTVVADIVEE